MHSLLLLFYYYLLLRYKTHQNLQREPCIADALDVEKCYVRISLRLIQHPSHTAVGRFHRGVSYHRNAHIRMGFQAKRQYRHTYEEHRYHTNYLRDGRCNRVVRYAKLENLITSSNLGHRTYFGSIRTVRFIEQGPNLRFHVLPPGNRPAVIVILVAKFPGQFLFCGLFGVQV